MTVRTCHQSDHAATDELVREVAARLAEGGVVAFPTETVYGVAASAGSEAGVQALRRLKEGGPDQAYTIHLGDPAELGQYVELTAGLERIVNKLLPGPVTLVLEIGEEAVDAAVRRMGLDPALRDRVSDGRAIAFRCPDHPLARQLLRGAEPPVVASSANRPGQRPAVSAADLEQAFGQQVDLVVDGGRCRFARPSTVVRIQPTGLLPAVSVEREGVYDARIIRRMLSWTMLMVCSGNTCRSPMAAAIGRQLLAQRHGMPEEQLSEAGLHVTSAGLYASHGAPASPAAIEALRGEGIDLSRHRSQPLTPELVNEADLILTMTQAHRDEVAALVPSAAEKIRPLDPEADISDPIGADTEGYRRTGQQIRRRLAERLKELG